MQQNSKKYDLENRTLIFAKNVRKFLQKIPRSISNFEDAKQLARASASVGANYIEANESLSKKDFAYRVKISRKESKESRFFLNLINVDGNPDLIKEKEILIQEASELMNIFGAIHRKTEQDDQKK